ncbi:RpiR family transcriptional regulator [Tamaricihabitans halophyticus]|uniref:RpiR family transcriptional regulator n=1 Tax=Tamaricihabitans halophyticus TaxID=1262583 RepID=A0A4R2QK13_9PSEU|nr:MurR/RpiR family transcriptional regulator [Tamaricihabitans halophyticus]TCP47325.1 RpiR family transcriptional regulator [Tamaricihabitans halophyticus]
MQTLSERVDAHWAELRQSERTVAQFLAQNRSSILFSSASQLAEEVGSSDATVVRTARALGYSGLPDLKRQVGIELTHGVAPTERLEETISRSANRPEGPVVSVIEDAEESHAQLKAAIDLAAIAAATELLLASPRVLTWGLGASGAAARYAGDRLSRVGLSASHLDRNGFQLANELVGLRENTCLLLFVPGRRHPDLKLLLHAAITAGAQSVLVTNSHGPDIRKQASHVIDLPHSTTGLTSEVLTEVLLVDILATTLLSRTPDAARESRRRLTEYRQFLDESKGL